MLCRVIPLFGKKLSGDAKIDAILDEEMELQNRYARFLLIERRLSSTTNSAGCNLVRSPFSEREMINIQVCRDSTI